MNTEQEKLIRDFEACTNGRCVTNCPYIDKDDPERCDRSQMNKDVLEVIRKLRAENEHLSELLDDTNQQLEYAWEREEISRRIEKNNDDLLANANKRIKYLTEWLENRNHQIRTYKEIEKKHKRMLEIKEENYQRVSRKLKLLSVISMFACIYALTIGILNLIF